MKVVIIAVLLMLSAICSATETAFSSCNRIRLKKLADDGNKSAKKAMNICDNFDKALTAILVGNNVVNISSSSIATVLFTEKFGKGSVGLATVVMTVLVLIFGEILPKSLAKENSERFSILMAAPLSAFMFIITPITAIFMGIKSGVSKLVGNKNSEPSVTEEELKYIIDEIQDEGVLEEQERDLVKSALEFDETVVDEIITHRVDVIAVDVNEDIETVKKTFINEEYSRLPVYEGSIDHIIGFVSQKDFFKKYLTKKDDETFLLRDIMQEIHYVPHLMKISDIMKQMQKDKVHMAVVLDQYGGTLGIVTLEDILEQLVGEIWDENDEIIAPVTFVSENEFNVNGDVSLTAFKRYWHNRTGDSPKIDGNAKTVGGWVLELFGKIPETNESVTTDDFRITVLKVSERRIVKVRLTVIPKSENKE